MNATISISNVKEFRKQCEVAIRNVHKGTKKATIVACEEIMANSRAEVPADTYTLLRSAYYDVRKRPDTDSFEAELGYGGNGDPINPRTGMPASSYAAKVHEDLRAYHAVGKAKFLEDPVREYAANNFARTVFKYVSESLAGMSD